jgi:hypothetical protein
MSDTEQKDLQREPDQWRRKALITLGGAFVTNVLAGGPARDLYSAVKSIVLMPYRWHIEREERLNLISEIFFPTGQVFDGVCADDHPVLGPPSLGHDTYTNEEYAVQAIRDLGRATSDFKVVDSPYEINPSHSIVSIGSSYANRLARAVMGETTNPSFSYSGDGFNVKLPYSISDLPSSSVNRLEDGTRFFTSRRGIVTQTQKEFIPRMGTAGILETDFLLVTLMPWSLSGVDLLLLTGVHGPGVLAIKQLLFDIPIDDLRSLAKRVRGHKYFQAVFEIPKVREDGQTQVPEGIRLIPDTISVGIVT